MTDDPGSLAGFLALAASVGVVHTLVGPDHYLLDRGVGQGAEGRVARGHVVHTVGGSAALRDERHRGVCVALAVGWVRGLVGVWRLCVATFWPGRWWPSGLHGPFPGGVVDTPLRMTLSRRCGPGCWRWFALGPCEWLLPNALAASASHGWQGAALVIAVFTLATVATMLVCVAATVKLPVPRKLAGPMMPGIVTFACGLMVLIGL